jgi:hypothetical protein
MTGLPLSTPLLFGSFRFLPGFMCFFGCWLMKFRSNLESVDHLFFKCFVVSHIWRFLSEVFKVQVGADFESVARWWISNNKNDMLNLFTSATLWSIRSLRNELFFQGRSWLGLDAVWTKVCACIRRWRVLCTDVHSSLLDRNLLLLQRGVVSS